MLEGVHAASASVVRAEASGMSWPMTAGSTASAPTAPPRAQGPLKWQPREPGSMGQRSTCEWYSVCEIHCGDEVTFETWTRNPLTGGMTQIAVGLADWREARKIAQADANQAAQTSGGEHD